MPPSLGHLVLHVRDLERSTRFYVDVLGWSVRGPVGRAGTALGSGLAPLELVLLTADVDAPPADGAAVGPQHVGIRVGEGAGDLGALRDRLEAASVAIEGATDDGTMHTIHVRDPDGTALALYVEAVEPDVWRRRHDLLRVPPRPLDG